MSAQFVAVWPLDPDISYRAAVAEGERRLDALCELAGVRRYGNPAWTVTENITGTDSTLALCVTVPAFPVAADFGSSDALFAEDLVVV